MDIRPEITPPWSMDKYGLCIHFKPRTKKWEVFYLCVRQSKGRQPLLHRSGTNLDEVLASVNEALTDGLVCENVL